jgi:hypothetical protein
MFGAVAAVIAGAAMSLVVSVASRAGLELVPNRKGEKVPPEFCRYEVANLLPDPNDCLGLAPPIEEGVVICTQCPNGGIKGKCRSPEDKEAFIPLLGIKIHKTDCKVRLTTNTNVCVDCDNGFQFFWLEKV